MFPKIWQNYKRLAVGLEIIKGDFRGGIMFDIIRKYIDQRLLDLFGIHHSYLRDCGLELRSRITSIVN